MEFILFFLTTALNSFHLIRESKQVHLSKQVHHGVEFGNDYHEVLPLLHQHIQFRK